MLSPFTLCSLLLPYSSTARIKYSTIMLTMKEGIILTGFPSLGPLQHRLCHHPLPGALLLFSKDLYVICHCSIRAWLIQFRIDVCKSAAGYIACYAPMVIALSLTYLYGKNGDLFDGC